MRTAVLFAIVFLASAACFAGDEALVQNESKISINYPATDKVGRARPSRIWTDSSGRFQIEAVLMGLDAQTATLRRVDRLVVRVPLDRLSDNDRKYLGQLRRRSDGNLVSLWRVITRTITTIPRAASTQITMIGRAARKQMDAIAADLPTTDKELDRMPVPRDIVYVDISERVLRKRLSRPISQQTAVNDVIVGTPIRGSATITGTVGVRLIPASNRAVVDLLFQGQIDSHTIGYGGPVQVHSNGVTHFSAVKRLAFDSQGIEVLPARAAATTSTSIQGVSTNLPRIRGWIARRIGSRRALALQPAAERESARKAEAQIAAQFDHTAERSLHDTRRFVANLMRALPADLDLLRGQVHFATTPDELRLVLERQGGERVAIRPPALDAFGAPDIVIHVHRAVVNQLARDTNLQRRIRPLVTMLVAGQTERLVGILPDRPQSEFKLSPDGQWWSLVIHNSN